MKNVKASKAKGFNANAAAAAWEALETEVGRLRHIGSKAAYNRAVRQVDFLLMVTQGKPRHPLTPLLDLISDHIAAYEAREVPMPEGKPADVLRLLMQANGLTQNDLRDELGGQPVVSAVLRDQRPINARQARALAERFRVSPAVFIA